MGLEPTTTRITIVAPIEQRRGIRAFRGKSCPLLQRRISRPPSRLFPRVQGRGSDSTSRCCLSAHSLSKAAASSIHRLAVAREPSGGGAGTWQGWRRLGGIVGAWRLEGSRHAAQAVIVKAQASVPVRRSSDRTVGLLSDGAHAPCECRARKLVPGAGFERGARLKPLRLGIDFLALELGRRLAASLQLPREREPASSASRQGQRRPDCCQLHHSPRGATAPSSTAAAPAMVQAMSAQLQWPCRRSP